MSLEYKSGWIVACGRAAAAGGFIATTIALGVTTVGAPAASVYLWTLSEGVDLIHATPGETLCVASNKTTAGAVVGRFADIREFNIYP